MKLLVVECEVELLKSILNYFRTEGYACEAVTSYNLAREKIYKDDYDCYIFDNGLQDDCGITLLQELKKIKPEAGTIILSARNSYDEKSQSLNWGADDYMTKPFNLFELNTRVKAIIRRVKGEFNNIITFNEFRLIPDTSLAFINDKEVPLTKKEFDLLMYFILNKNKILSKESIAEHLWGDDADTLGPLNFIYTHIRNLRKKIEQAEGTDYFQSIHNLGYKFTG